MAEASVEDWLSGPMTRAELKELSPDEKKERNRLKNRITSSINYHYNREEKLAKNKKYQEEHKEEMAEYRQTPACKKSISNWKRCGLEESPEDLEWIYHLWLTQELCYSCDIKLTRDGVCCATQACMDHCRITNRFRQIACRSCNTMDRWMKYWC